MKHSGDLDVRCPTTVDFVLSVIQYTQSDSRPYNSGSTVLLYSICMYVRTYVCMYVSVEIVGIVFRDRTIGPTN